MCISATSEGHGDLPEGEMPVGASGEIYPLLDPQSKSEVGTETETPNVAELAVKPLIGNPFVASLTAGNNGEGNSVDPVAVVDGEGELQGKKGTCMSIMNKSNN